MSSEKKTLVSELANKNFIVVNKDVAKTLGINEAILLGELVEEYEYYKNRDLLENGWFFSIVENIENNTGLTGRQQRPALENLVKAGLIEKKNKGLPPKRFFKVKMGAIRKYVKSFDKK